MKRVVKYILNVCLWLICSLPVISLGASTVAMHFVNFKLVKDENINVYREFMKSFKQNFVQSIGLLVICVPIGAFVGWNWVKQLTRVEEANLFVVGILFITSLVFFAFESCTTYLLSKFDNKTGRLVMLSFYTMLRHCDISIKIAIMEAATVALPIFIIVLNPVPSFIAAGVFAAIVMVVIHEITSSRWMTQIFDILIAAQNAAMAQAAGAEASAEQDKERSDSENTAE